MIKPGGCPFFTMPWALQEKIICELLTQLSTALTDWSLELHSNKT